MVLTKDVQRNIIRFQIALFVLIIVFWIGLSLGFVHIPTGEEGKWFEKIWDIILVVSNFTNLAMAIKTVDEKFGAGGNDEKLVPAVTVDNNTP